MHALLVSQASRAPQTCQLAAVADMRSFCRDLISHHTLILRGISLTFLQGAAAFPSRVGTTRRRGLAAPNLLFVTTRSSKSTQQPGPLQK